MHRRRIWSVENIQRDNVKDIHTRLLKQIIVSFCNITGDAEMIQFGKKLKTARNSLFTFVKYAGVPSTNNDAENAVRSAIMQRNVRGLMKNNQGMKCFLYF